MSDSTIDAALLAARVRLGPRPGPGDLAAIVRAGGVVVDIRPVELREKDGALTGAAVIDRNQLEWRLDPTSPHRSGDVTTTDQQVVLVCDEGYASSLAALQLRDLLGLVNATDLDGGYQAWLQAGSPDLVTGRGA
jgi:rhodanese-related sulfurtransferase